MPNLKVVVLAAAAILAPAVDAKAETGIASVYSDLSQTASGRAYKASDLVAAHRTLPFGTKVRVHSVRSGKSVVVTIVDRGPFVAKRIIDLSTGAGRHLGISGIAKVRLAIEK